MHVSGITGSMRSLVAALGCLDAAAEAISARWGGSVQKGTLSKRLSGELQWLVTDVIALEDAVGRYPVTRQMVRRIGAGRSDEPLCVARDRLVFTILALLPVLVCAESGSDDASGDLLAGLDRLVEDALAVIRSLEARDVG